MGANLSTVNVSDDEWEAAALAQLRADLMGYPGGVKQFVEDHEERLGMGYFAFLNNLKGKSRMAYRTFTRAVHILGYTTWEYDAKIDAQIAATRRNSS